MDTQEILKLLDRFDALEDKVKKAFLELYRQQPKTESESTKELAAALAKAQGKMDFALMDKMGHHKNLYASLKQTLKVAYPALSENGLSIEVKLITDDGKQYFKAILRHSSGEWTSSEMVAPISPKDWHQFGSNTTYARRYLISALIGIAPTDDEDDDAEATMNEVRKEEEKGINLGPSRPAKNVSYETISKDQYDEVMTELNTMADMFGEDEANRTWESVRKLYQITELRYLPRENYRAVVDKIRHVKNLRTQAK